MKWLKDGLLNLFIRLLGIHAYGTIHNESFIFRVKYNHVK